MNDEIAPSAPHQGSAEPKVRIVRKFSAPFASVLTAARTCYSSTGVVDDGDLRPGGETLARDLYEAGHHTTFEHAYFQFSIENVSRQFLWSFLHAHPFYNSEQVSQRYVKVRASNCFVPPITGEARVVYLQGLEEQLGFYRELLDRLTPVAQSAYDARFPARVGKREKYGKDVTRKAQEIARYVLPVATFAFLYHTLSALTLLRYWKVSSQAGAPYEQRLVVGRMVEALLECDPGYRRVLDQPIPEGDTAEARFLSQREDLQPAASRARFVAEFDAALEGRISRLVGWSARGEEAVASAVREVVGATRAALSDAEAITLAISPRRNPIFGQALNVTTLDRLARALHHSAYTFRKKISHAADSQNQRHRMTPASRPVLAAHSTGDPDFVTPALVLEDGSIAARYGEMMERIWTRIARLRRLGVSEEFAQYLLPNAVAIRFTESADFLNLRHKHVMRLCYLAQEEIWQASIDEARQVAEVHPSLGRWLLPPCTLRKEAGTGPWCPEGGRFCGVAVWNLPLADYRRTI